MINDIHNLLENCKDLSNEQKLEYCNSERHYMKEYLKYTLIKVNKRLPD
jgi:ribosomal protein S15P/S13E